MLDFLPPPDAPPPELPPSADPPSTEFDKELAKLLLLPLDPSTDDSDVGLPVEVGWSVPVVSPPCWGVPDEGCWGVPPEVLGLVWLPCFWLPVEPAPVVPGFDPVGVFVFGFLSSFEFWLALPPSLCEEFVTPPAVAVIELPIDPPMVAIDWATFVTDITFVTTVSVLATVTFVMLFTIAVVTDWQGELEFCWDTWAIQASNAPEVKSFEVNILWLSK